MNSERIKMILFILWILLFFYLNHFIYKAHLKVKYKTLYFNIKPLEWRDYLIQNKI